MKFALVFTGLIAVAITHALATETSTDNPGGDASRKYSPLQGSDTNDNAAYLQLRERMPSHVGRRLPPQQHDIVAGAMPHDSDENEYAGDA
ncbi:hypothetical protein DFH09DRAFT_1379988 [Mycena vulgaris]|nr:hypothetical protein DFH09DRAFT_1379988 [Mycena vulgaris]